MLTTVLGEPYTKGSRNENPIGTAYCCALFNARAIVANKFSSESSTDIDLQESHGNETCHNTNFKHINEKHVSELGRPSYRKK